ncbi:MAG: hypothetical protein GY699_09330 [Desulfobacteraceae bacterium]|nr:hypothetical protein [Desulfobacteraceae bacterium]
MKLLTSITTIMVLVLFSLSNAIAADKSDCIYGSKVDQAICFYQARLYLIDSEYKILSDIGKDAAKMVNYLQKEKQQLVKDMKDRNIDFKTDKIRAYVINQARLADVGFGYTKAVL